MRVNLVENKDTYKKQFNLTLTEFISELINCIPELIDAVLANSILVWADVFGSIEITLHYLFILLTIRNVQKDDGNKYNYGVERLETLVSFTCDIFLIISYLVVITISISQLSSPVKPNYVIGVFLFLKTLNISFDVYFYIKSKINQKIHPSRLNETETAAIENELIEDIIMGIIVGVYFFFREYSWSWYISPVVSIILSGIFIVSALKRVKAEFGEITDVSTTIEDQDKIFDILLEYRSAFDKIDEINCHFLNHRLIIDMKVTFKENVTYSDQIQLLKEITDQANLIFNDAELSFVIENQREITVLNL